MLVSIIFSFLQCFFRFERQIVCFQYKHLTIYSIDTHFDASTALENIVGKGEIARNEQFLIFPLCFPLNQIISIPICPYF